MATPTAPLRGARAMPGLSRVLVRAMIAPHTASGFPAPPTSDERTPMRFRIEYCND